MKANQENNTHQSIPSIIWSQISLATKMACGMRQPIADGNTLITQVLRAKRKLRITLTGMDDYDIELITWDKDYNVKVIESHDGIYCDQLSEVIYHMCNK